MYIIIDIIKKNKKKYDESKFAFFNYMKLLNII